MARAAVWGTAFAILVGGYGWLQQTTRESAGMWMAGLILLAFSLPLAAGAKTLYHAVAGLRVGVRSSEARMKAIGWVVQVAAVGSIIVWMWQPAMSGWSVTLMSAGVAFGSVTLIDWWLRS